VRAETPSIPGSGRTSSGENDPSQSAPAGTASPQDEVKLQFDPPGETAVYQFVDQQGGLILQVPSQQMLNLANEISQELVQEAAHEASAAVARGKDHAD
jgi:hypothetical protein